jgi:hypothetical protein
MSGISFYACILGIGEGTSFFNNINAVDAGNL